MPPLDHPYRAGGDATVIHVAPGGKDKWTGHLARPNGHDSDGPLPSLACALQHLAIAPPTRPVTILVEGCHHLSQPLVIGPDTPPLTIRGAPGARISGGVPVSGFEERVVDGRRRWTTHLPEVAAGTWYFRELRVGAVSRPRPRLPKIGTRRISAVPGMRFDGFIGPAAAHHERFQVEPGAIDPTWRNLRDIDAVAVHYWLEERLPLAAFNADGLVTAQVKPRFPLKDDVQQACARYWLENVAEALTEPGEWYLDRVSGDLTYLPSDDEQLGAVEVVAARLDHLIALQGEPGRPVTGVVLENLAFSDVDWQPIPGRGTDSQAAFSVPAMLRLDHARHCAVVGCQLGPGGGYGISIGPGCHGDRVEDCVITDLGAGGIHVYGSLEEPAQTCSHHRLAGNHIHHCTRLFPSAVGILLRHASHCAVLDNHIHHLEYSGISVGWIWGFGSSPTHHCRIDNNHIHDLGSGLLNDMGGIYTLGEQPGTVLCRNHIHDIRADGYGGWAIYLDEGSSHLVVEDNLCHDTTSECLNLHYGRENIIRNNLFARAGLGVVSVSAVGSDWNSLTLNSNLILTCGTPVLVARDEDRLAQRGFRSDLNLFWDLDDGAVAAGDEHRDADGRVTWTRHDLEQIQALGYDRHSMVADPGLIPGSWLLTATSPAWDLGFRPFIAAGTPVGESAVE